MGRNNPAMIIPSLAPEASDPELDRLLSPVRHFRHPDDVLADGTLTLQEKRAILISWASDTSTAEAMPMFCRPPGTDRLITFEQIMDALGRFDEANLREPARRGPNRLDA